MKQKLCMLGAFAVGKTSLVSRFLHGTFSPRYLTTVGVKVDRRDVVIARRHVQLMVWDIHGEDEFQAVRSAYVRGASGCLYVVDGTRRSTLSTALGLQRRVEAVAGPIPSLLLLSKADLRRTWEVDVEDVRHEVGPGCAVRVTSAKTGLGVGEAFESIAARMVHAACLSAPNPL